MSRISSNRAKAVAPPKKPEAKPKARKEAAAKDTGWSAKNTARPKRDVYYSDKDNPAFNLDMGYGGKFD